mgnify:FL=1
MRVTPQVGERLQNVLAARGAASRRGAAELIREGRVAVDGRTVFEPGARVLPEANITLDGRPLSAPEPLRTFLYYKPAGEVCSTDGQGSRSVLEAFDRFSLRLVPVGRLDKASEGLLLISNDGALIQALTHPRFGHKKVYEVDVSPAPTPAQVARLRGSMTLEGYAIRPVLVEPITSKRLRFTLSEGRHRQIRLMCEQVGLRVLRLKRVSLSGLTLGRLMPGRFRELSPAECAALRAPAAVPKGQTGR